MAPSKPVFRKVYNLRSTKPPTLQQLFSNAPIQAALIEQGQFDRYDLFKLERAGVRAGLSEEAHRSIFTGDEKRCECTVNFQVQPRGNRNAGVGQCPNTTLSCIRIKRCDGSLRHEGQPHTWSHSESLRLGGRWEPLVEFRSNNRHPPGLGVMNVPFLVCSECLRDAEYGYMSPSHRRGRRDITDSWAPFCKSHSLEIYSILKVKWTVEARKVILCRCVADINRGWACNDHRMATLAAIQRRATHHKEWLRRTRLRRPRRPRLGPDFEEIKKRRSRERRTGHAATQWYYDDTKEPKIWTGCPAYGCGKPSWRNPTAVERMAKCLGCGGTQPCIGMLGDLSPFDQHEGE